ncbi:ABC-2 transporter permease [Actinomyces sp. B33]|uniref:ABC-2 transporter permease n=1 Tax=Actinomyces sp. B33 TaxID=2942131 RepID=UPI002341A266|nr:ABC-2 transporter permease [Actinomyces sp. B33]MDC4233740.1 ABC-2 transporter permease [Actinomyces sp. B33]
MRTVFATDLASTWRLHVQQGLLGAVAALCVAWGAGPAAMAPMLIGMIALGFLFNASAYDDINGWLAFRAALPVSRRAMTVGRYASVLVQALGASLLAFLLGLGLNALTRGLGPIGRIRPVDSTTLLLSVALGLGIAMTACALCLPLIARFGLTRGIRLLPLVLVVLALVGSWLADESVLRRAGEELLQWVSAVGAGAIVAVGLIACLILYGASMAASIRLFRSRQL